MILAALGTRPDTDLAAADATAGALMLAEGLRDLTLIRKILMAVFAEK